jgi:pimeloyl-ACP methyl ester carboxylesterase
VSYRSFDGTKLVGVLHIPDKRPRGNIILAHGITADKDEDGLFTQTAGTLCNNGFRTMRFDFRGHGESGGSKQDMTITGEAADLQSTIELAVSEEQLPLGILAASFGAGPAIICAAQGNDFEVSSMVLWNPVLDYKKTFLNAELPWGRAYFNERSYKILDSQGYLLLGDFPIGRKLVQEMASIRPYELMKKLSCPILTFHGDKDSKVPYEVSRQYAVCNPGSKFVTVEGSDHGFPERADQKKVIRESTEWFLNTLH